MLKYALKTNYSEFNLKVNKRNETSSLDEKKV